jgi:hypothetical protein
MPEQKQIDRLAATTPAQPGEAKAVFYAPDDPAFAALQHWVITRGTDVYLLWLVTHPLYVITEPLHRPERSYNFGNGDLTIYAATTNRDGSPLTVVMWPPLIWVVAMAVLASYLAVLSGVWRDRSWRVVVVLTVIGLLAMLVAWNGDGQEVTRHTVEGAVQVRLGLWVLALFGLFELVPARTRAPGTDDLGHPGPDDGDRIPSPAGPGPLTPVPPHS